MTGLFLIIGPLFVSFVLGRKWERISRFFKG